VQSTIVTNTTADDRDVAAYTKAPCSAGHSSTATLQQNWPRGIFSLSHVALPFPPDDPLYGAQRPIDQKHIFLGQQAMQGERGVLRIPRDFLLRLRHNPFYSYQEARIPQWLE